MPEGIMKINEYEHRKNLFINNIDADAYYIIKNKLIGRHKKILKECKYFANLFQKQNKILYEINEKFDVFMFEKIISCLYGIQYKYPRNQEVFQIMQTIQFLNIPKLRQILVSDFVENFQIYGVFLMYEIASFFSIQNLKQKCFRELIYLNFEQLKFQSFQLLNSSKPNFENIIKYHQDCVANGLVKGQPKYIIRNLIREYSQINECSINPLILTLIPKNSIKETDSEYISEKEQMSQQNEKGEVQQNIQYNQTNSLEKKSSNTQSTLTSSIKNSQSVNNQEKIIQNNNGTIQRLAINPKKFRKYLCQFDNEMSPNEITKSTNKNQISFGEKCLKMEPSFLSEKKIKKLKRIRSISPHTPSESSQAQSPQTPSQCLKNTQIIATRKRSNY